MIQNVLRNMSGIDAYGIISIGIFFAVFLGVLVWALRLKKPFLNAMAQLPLNEDSETSKTTRSHYEQQ